MYDEKIEQRIRAAINHAAPDPLEEILCSCQTQERKEIPMKKKQAKVRWFPIAVAAALVLVCTAFGMQHWSRANAVASVVSLDVNPSIELNVSADERVLSAKAVNADAEVILDGMDLENTQLPVAVNAIIGSLLQHGYLDRVSSAILISVDDTDTSRADRLQQELTADVNAALQGASSQASVFSQTMTADRDLTAQAQANHISVGKAHLIQQICAQNNQLSFDALSSLTAKELQQLSQSAAPALPIGMAAADAAVEAYAGISKADALYWDTESELDEVRPYYEIEVTTTNGEMEYTVDAYTGEILAAIPDTSDVSPSVTPSVDETAAKTAALQHAGYSTADVQNLQCRLTQDDGVPVYEVTFNTGDTLYSYEVRGTDSAILDVDREYSLPSNADDIGTDAAAQAAFSRAGVSASSVSHLQCQLDYENGVRVYEVQFYVGSMQYDCEVNAATGEVYDFSAELDD